MVDQVDIQDRSGRSLGQVDVTDRSGRVIGKATPALGDAYDEVGFVRGAATAPAGGTSLVSKTFTVAGLYEFVWSVTCEDAGIRFTVLLGYPTATSFLDCHLNANENYVIKFWRQVSVNDVLSVVVSDTVATGLEVYTTVFWRRLVTG